MISSFVRSSSMCDVSRPDIRLYNVDRITNRIRWRCVKRESSMCLAASIRKINNHDDDRKRNSFFPLRLLLFYTFRIIPRTFASLVICPSVVSRFFFPFWSSVQNWIPDEGDWRDTSSSSSSSTSFYTSSTAETTWKIIRSFSKWRNFQWSMSTSNINNLFNEWTNIHLA